MTGQCCALHTNTCGHLDICCPQCPTQRGSDLGQLLAGLVGVVLLVLFGLAIA